MKLLQALQQSLDNKTPLEQLSWIATLLLALAVMVLAVLQLVGVFDNILSMALPMMGVALALQAYNFRKVSKFSSTISLIGAIIIAVVMILAQLGS